MIQILFNRLVLIVCLIMMATVSGGSATKSSIVQTDSGRVKGTHETTLLGQREYSAFRGIPYAKAPIGPLRFKAPVALDAWPDEVLDASNFGDICIQPSYIDGSLKLIGSEDCLTLNIFTPSKLLLHNIVEFAYRMTKYTLYSLLTQ